MFASANCFADSDTLVPASSALANSCVVDFTGVYQDSFDMEPVFEDIKYTCAAGQYLPANSTSCDTCSENSYCIGGNNYIYSATSASGISECSTLGDHSYTLSAGGATGESACYKLCAKENFANAATVSGNEYFGGTNTCRIDSCDNGYDVANSNQSCAVKTYSITYDLNDISDTVNPAHGSVHPDSYTIEDATFAISDPSMRGYTFNGWSVMTQPSAWGAGSSTSGAKSFSVATGTYGNIAFKANWTANSGTPYVVNHYTKNLGSATYTLNSTTDGAGTSNADLTLANLAKSIPGFTYDEGFAGTSATGTTKPASGSTSSTTILADGTRVVNLYYNRDSYTVTLTAGKGTSNLVGAGTYEYGASVSLDATVANGYDWSKWTQTGNGSDVSLNQKYTFTMGVNNVAYTANANIKTYTIKLNLNGGTNSVTVPETYTIETNTISLGAPTKAGYTFEGWCDNSALTTGCSTNKTIPQGSTGNKEYWAKWSANADVVSFDVNATNAVAGTASVDANRNVMMPTPIVLPTRPGYTFAGYYDTSAATGGKQYYTETGSAAREWDKTGATTLYARWTLCGENHYCPGDNVAHACATGLVSPEGTTSAGGCGKIMHVGDDVLYLTSERQTLPALAVKIDGTVYYARTTRGAKPMNGTTSKSLRTKIDGVEYSIHDNTAQGE